METELKKLSGIPIKRPLRPESTQKVLGIGLFLDITLEDWLKQTPYPIDKIAYDFYLKRFGLAAMKDWTSCENGSPTVNSQINSLDKTFFQDSSFNEELF